MFITALTAVTGSFQDALEESSRVLAIRGRVVPSTLDNIRLRAEYSDGTVVEGEDKIPEDGKVIQKVTLIPGNVTAHPEALDAIRQADIIIFGPGSLFTSVIPNLLISKIVDEISKHQALKMYICNVMSQPGETSGFTASDHLKVFIEHSRKNIVNCCLVNSGRLEYQLLLKYARQKSFPVILDRERIREMGVVVFEADVVSRTDYLRHDSQKIAKEIINCYNLYSRKKWNELNRKLS